MSKVKQLIDITRDFEEEIERLPTENAEDDSKNYAEQFFEMFESKQKKLTIEDTHTRTTFLIDNNLRKRLDNLSEGKKGFKTSFVNTALRVLLDEVENRTKK